MAERDRPPGYQPEDDPHLNLRGGADEGNEGQQTRSTRGGLVIQPAERRAGRRVSRQERRPSARPSGDVLGPVPAPDTTPRLPAKRQQSIIEISSSPDEAGSDADGDIVSKPRVKRGKLSSTVPERGRMPLSSLSVKQDDLANMSSDSVFKEARHCLPTNKIYHNFERHNQDKVVTAITGMRVELSNDLVSPRRQGIMKSIDLLLSLPQTHEYTPVVKHHQKHMALDIKRHPTVWQLTAKHSTLPNVLVIANLPQEEYSEDEAKAVCKMFVQIMNHWPADLGLLAKPATGFKSGTGHARLLTLACRHRVLPNKPIICTLPTFKAPKPKGGGIEKENHFQLWQSCIDPTTYRQRDDSKRASARTIGSSLSIPELSDQYQFVAYDTRGGFTQIIKKTAESPDEPPSFRTLLPSEVDLSIPQEERDGLINAERILRLYSATLTNQGFLINLEGCKNIWMSLLEKYGSKVSSKGTSRGIFGGSDLLQVWPRFSSFDTVMTPGVTVEKQLREINESYSLPPLVIRSTDRAWALPVEEAISDTWLLEGDLLKAWTRGAEVADLANISIRNGERPPSSCMCTPSMAEMQTHPCGQCGVLRVCKDLAQSEFDDRRVCSSCRAKLQRRSQSSQVEEYLSNRMHSLLKVEQKNSKGLITDVERTKVTDRCIEELKGMLPSREETAHAGLTHSMAWKDGYSGTLYALPTDNTSVTRSHPERPSIDAVFPSWLTDFGYRIHCPGNLIITTQAINYLKAIQIPAFLAMLCWYEHERTRIEGKYHPNIWGPEARAELDVLDGQMVKISKRLRIIRLTFEWTQLRRLRAKKTSRTRFDITLAPLISGQLQPELRGSMNRLDKHHNFMHTAPELSFPEEELARVRTLAQEIMDFFDVDLSKGQDGCPYFGHPESMPEVWNWSTAYALSEERLTRMKLWCNRYFPTYETCETIFLECIFQACILRCAISSSDEFYDIKRHLKGKYASILGLPMTIAYHDGLTFALGHAQHGEAMVTGWPMKPCRLDERLDGDANNNIRVEPRSENYLKADYHSSTYPSLKKMIMGIDLPKEVYNTSLKPQSLSKDDLEDLVWNGEEISDDLFNEAFAMFDPVADMPEDLGTSLANPEISVQRSPSVKTKLSMRVKSNTTDYSEGLSEGEIENQWAQSMAVASTPFQPTVRTPSLESRYSEGLSAGELENQWEQSMAVASGRFQPTARTPSLESHYSGGIASEDVEQESSWNQAMGNTMQSQYEEVMRLVASHPTLDAGFQDLLKSLRDAKERGDDLGFMAILAVIRGEIS